MDQKLPRANHSTVVSTVFESFIEELRRQGKADTSAIHRLEKALLQGEFSVDKIRNALFSEDPLQ